MKSRICEQFSAAGTPIATVEADPTIRSFAFRKIDTMDHALAECPLQHPTPTAALAPDEELVLPLHKRVVTQYASGEDGAPELRLFYGDKEISFDEPELFPFGERLAKQERFLAGSAAAWGPGYAWPQVRELLETLIEEGVLLRAPDAALDSPTGGDVASPLPPAPAGEPSSAALSWNEPAQVASRLVGRTLEPGHLELVVPIFRIAHPALDAEGRQVGESNVFPKGLRLEVPTRWRTCIYPGTRFQADRPMNVSALKSMRAHWPQMMVMLARAREAYLERFPAARGGWTVGHLERLATTVLALPTYMLVRRGAKVANGALHPALSCLFRVTDGLRMTMHQMLFVPIGEPALPPDTPVTSREVLAYAERNYSFYGDHGVCAGPQIMIEHFFAVLVDGAQPDPAPLAPELEDAIGALGEAVDYGMLALQAHAAAFSVWPAMARAYETIAAICEEWAEAGEPGVVLLRDRLRRHLASLKASTYLATEEWRASRDQAYADMFAQCAAGHSETRNESLPAQIAAQKQPRDEGLARALRLALASALDVADGDGTHAQQLAGCLMTYAETEQALVRVACSVQRRINAMLGRPAPQQPFAAHQLNIHNLLQRGGSKEDKEDAKRLPYLWDELEAALGIRLDALEDGIRLNETDTAPACGATGFRRQTSPV
jgi:hypothetical protein